VDPVSGLVDEQQPPDRRAFAETVCTVLALERVLGTLPTETVIRAYVVIDDDRIMIAIGGLSDLFLLGPHRDLAEQAVIESHYFTGPALRLRREIERVIAAQLPYRASGEPWFRVIVWMQPEPWWRKCADADPEGVIEVTSGELR
jgi:hypothetical protein